MTRLLFLRTRSAWLLLLTLACFAAPQGVLAQEDAEGQPAQMTREELEAKLNEAIQNGRQQYADADYEAAVESFDIAVQMTGGQNPTPLYLRAQALIGDEQYEEALEDLKSVLTYGQAVPGLTARARNLRAEAYLELGAVDRALKDATSAVKENRSVLEFQHNYGRALVLSGNPSAGEKALTKYLEFDDQKAQTYQLRAQAYAGMAKYEKALVDIDQAIELDPADHENYFIKAQIYLQEEEFEPAAAALRQAIDTYEPDDPDLPMPYVQAFLTRASVLEEWAKELDDPEEARKLYEEEKKECETLLDALPDLPTVAASKAGALFRLGVAERLLGNLEAAVKAFGEALEINPALGEAYFRRGICFFYLDQPGLALGDFRQGAAINYDSPRSNLWKGRCHVELGDYREAIKAFSEAVAVSDRYTIAYIHRGITYMQVDEYQRALGDFENAIRLEVTEGSHYYYQGLAYQALGDPDRAMAAFVNAIKLSPELVEAYEAAADVLEGAGRRDLANQYRQKAAEVRATPAEA